MIEDIIKTIQKLKGSMESNIPLLDLEINSIIENREQSFIRIERLLDTLLDYLYLGVGKDQFLKLNFYYGSFCPEYSENYSKFYHEIVD